MFPSSEQHFMSWLHSTEGSKGGPGGGLNYFSLYSFTSWVEKRVCQIKHCKNWSTNSHHEFENLCCALSWSQRLLAVPSLCIRYCNLSGLLLRACCLYTWCIHVCVKHVRMMQRHVYVIRVCVMHVTNGDERRDGKLNFRSRMYTLPTLGRRQSVSQRHIRIWTQRLTSYSFPFWYYNYNMMHWQKDKNYILRSLGSFALLRCFHLVFSSNMIFHIVWPSLPSGQ